MTNMHLFDDESLQIQQSIVVLFFSKLPKTIFALDIFDLELAIIGLALVPFFGWKYSLES